MGFYPSSTSRPLVQNVTMIGTRVITSASAYAEMFEERTGIPIQQIVILVVTEDGVVQEFIKEKTEYLPMLINAVDDFTTDWEKENEKLDESPAVIGVLCSGNAYAEISEEQKEAEEKGLFYWANKPVSCSSGEKIVEMMQRLVKVQPFGWKGL